MCEESILTITALLPVTVATNGMFRHFSHECVIMQAIKKCHKFSSFPPFHPALLSSSTLCEVNLTVLKLVCDSVVGINMEWGGDKSEGSKLRQMERNGVQHTMVG